MIRASSGLFGSSLLPGSPYLCYIDFVPDKSMFLSELTLTSLGNNLQRRPPWIESKPRISEREAGFCFLIVIVREGVSSMEESKDRYKTAYRNVTLKTTDGSTITGRVNIGIKERVSDLFTKTESQFLVLQDAEHSSGSGKVLFVNKDHIVWAEPEE